MDQPSAAFATFVAELERLVANFERNFPHIQQGDYNEASVRQEYLDPLFSALGWDVSNRAGLIHTEREVDIEVRTAMSGRQTRADYVFRLDRNERFTCEAKKPAEVLHDRHIYQAKRDAFARGIPLAILSDFEELKIYVVGARPLRDEPHVGEYRVLRFTQYREAARELWDLLARDNVAAGSIDRLIDSLPKRPLRLKGKQGYLIKPDRTRSLDAEFLNFLDDARQQLGSDLLKHNDRDALGEGNRLNEAAQRILDRLIFLRICEDRGIDTGTLLETLLRDWYRQQQNPPKLRRPLIQGQLPLTGGGEEEPPGHRPAPPPEGGLYRELVGHIQSLDQRPASLKPFFNGQLFKEHFSEELVVGDEWLANFLSDLTSDDSGYNFADIKVEILGDTYERFLGKVLRPQGRGATIEEKPEVRKAGGVYYTPRYIVDYIVEQAIGRLLEGKPPREVARLRFLDPSCGSGSFLLRVYERVMEHYLRWFTANPGKRRKEDSYVDAANNVRLTTALKRRILQENIYGVDLDAQAVEVTQLSLYLKMLEGENRDSLRAQTELFRNEALLPPLDGNIKCGNSLIASGFSLDPAELVRVNAFDWDVGFPAIMKNGGFDAVVGNPPYILLQDEFRDDAQLAYFREHFASASFKLDTYHLFLERGTKLTKSGGRMAMITPANFLTNNHLDHLRKFLLQNTAFDEVLVIDGGVFAGVSVDTAITVLRAHTHSTTKFRLRHAKTEKDQLIDGSVIELSPASILADKHLLFTAPSEQQSRLWEKAETCSRRLGEIASVNFGKQLRDRSKFTSDVIEVESIRSIKQTHRPCYTGRDIERYLVTWGNLACLTSTVAQSGGCWDEAKHRAKRKLLTRQIGKFPTFACDADGFDCLNTIFMVNVSCQGVLPQFLLGVLNSRLMQHLWLTRFYDQRGTFPKIKGTYLKLLPIVRIEAANKSTHDRLVSLVDKMLKLTPALRTAKNDAERAALQNAVTKTDQAIDALVYELYGLTPEEIALVEGTPAPAPMTAPQQGDYVQAQADAAHAYFVNEDPASPQA